MDAKWDLTFACDIMVINEYIRTQKIPFLKNFVYKSGDNLFSGNILTWSIDWAGNEKYMAIEMELTDVTIKYLTYCETYPIIKSKVKIQFAFAEDEPNKLKFICRSEAKSFPDPTIGAIWIDEADIDASITNSLLAVVYPELLNRMLIENEQNIEFVIAELDNTLLEVENLPIMCSVPSFQCLDSKVVIAMLCMTEKVQDLPAYQFDTSLLQGYSCGYILKKEVLIKRILFPYISSNLGLKSGSLQCTSEGNIINNGTLTFTTVRAGAVDYDVKSDYFNLRFIGDVLDLSINGNCPIKGLSGAYISYTFHAKRQGLFRIENGNSIVSFNEIDKEKDEFHSGVHIPDWEMIISNIFTFGLLDFIVNQISDTITEKMKCFFRSLNLNGGMGGYGVTWSKQKLSFTSGGLQTNLFMRK